MLRSNHGRSCKIDEHNLNVVTGNFFKIETKFVFTLHLEFLKVFCHPEVDAWELQIAIFSEGY